MKVLVTDYAWPDLEIERRLLNPAQVDIVAAETGDEDELAILAADVSGIFTNWKQVSKKVIANAPHCQVIVRYGVGLDNIDVEYATQKGVIVANVPDYCLEEVSDHALALLFALARKITWYDRRIKIGSYDLKSGTPMYRLRGKTLGIVGFGKIGKALRNKARALGLDVIVYVRESGKALDETVQKVSFSELLQRSDFISVHVPLTSQTHHLFSYSAFQQMKRTAVLINTARGGVVDSEALLAALNEGLIAGAGLDVLPNEPPDPVDPLLLHPKAIITPHAAFNSEEAVEELRIRAATAIGAVLLGRIPDSVVNPEVLRASNLRANVSQSAGTSK